MVDEVSAISDAIQRENERRGVSSPLYSLPEEPESKA